VKIVSGTVPEVRKVFGVEVVDAQRHAQIVSNDRHGSLPQPRSITTAEPVPGIAHPRFAVSSQRLTCRHPPSL
jgi:hypothetical protein